jgi:hypothetical protein
LVLCLAGTAAVCATPLPRRAQQLEDLEFARTAYVERSAAFSPSGREAARKLIRKLERRAGSLSDEEFMVSVMRIAALARNGHDSVDFGDDAWLPPKRAPLRLLWFSDALVIARAGPENSGLLGARVDEIEGLAPAELLRRLEVLSGGIEPYRRWNVTWYIENGLLHALGLARSSDRLRVVLRLANGTRVDRTIDFVPRASMPRGIHPPRLWSAAPYAEELPHSWRAATDPARDPLYLQEPELLYRMAPLAAADALYVQFRANDDEAHAINDFVTAVEQRVESDRPTNLVLDLRFDTGGNCDLTRDLMRWLPGHVAGRIFVLTGPYTFSAGIVSAAAIRHDGGERVAIVGEVVGDSLRWWSEGKPQCMPNSHLCLRPASGLWDLVKGCAGEDGCYGDKYDANVGSLNPDFAAPLTAAAWLAGRDPGLDAIMSELARKRTSLGKLAF